jgi:hypothetical protein
MSVQQMSLEEIRLQGLEALMRRLGPVGMVRFLQQFETGHGDYTEERRQWLTGTVQEIARDVSAARKS